MAQNTEICELGGQITSMSHVHFPEEDFSFGKKKISHHKALKNIYICIYITKLKHPQMSQRN